MDWILNLCGKEGSRNPFLCIMSEPYELFIDLQWSWRFQVFHWRVFGVKCPSFLTGPPPCFTFRVLLGLESTYGSRIKEGF